MVRHVLIPPLRLVASIALLALLFVAGPAKAQSAAVPATARASLIQQRVLDLVNRARARGHRCGNDFFEPTHPLEASGPLERAAARHAVDMARRGYFDHGSTDGSQPRDRVRRAGYSPRLTGENIAFGPDTAEEVVAGWLASPGHCANLMDPRFVHMGVSVARGRKRGHYYWVQDLGMPARNAPVR